VLAFHLGGLGDASEVHALVPIQERRLKLVELSELRCRKSDSQRSRPFEERAHPTWRGFFGGSDLMP
jgi:hypothetical protein